MRQSNLGYLLRRNAIFFVAAALFALTAGIVFGTGLLYTDVLITTAVFCLLVVGMDLLYGYTGLLSFGHVGFFAIGAYGVAVLAKHAGFSFFEGAAASLLINIVVGWILGRVLLRVSGLYFMLGTLSFGLMVHAVITVWYPVTGGDAGLGDIPRPILFGIDFASATNYGILTWVVVAILFWIAINLTRSRVGRALRAIRSDEISAACTGTHVARLRTNIFAVSAAYASVAGSLFASYFGAVHPDSFSLAVLLEVLLMLFFGGEGTIWGVLIGTVFMRALPDLSESLQTGKILFSGVLFTLIIFLFPRGVAGAINDLRQRFRTPRPASGPVPTMAQLMAGKEIHTAPDVLDLTNIGKSFGGLRAVDAVSFAVPRAAIKSLIGPNGAGKTTLINMISGVLAPSEGTVRFEGRALDGLRADQVARLGVQRTFQHERLFAQLTVLENVMVGCEHGSDGSLLDLVKCGLAFPQTLRDEQKCRAEAEAWLARVGLSERADEQVNVLPHGLRKLVEVARAGAAKPSLLLLDETAAGLNNAEKEGFKTLIREMRDQGVTVLLIEHDMDFVMDLSDEVVVVNFGRRIADATPAQVRKDEAVIAAYLGA